MKEMDCIEVIVEKECYSKEGVHKGMQGWVCLDDLSSGALLINFPLYGEKGDIATISVEETDLKPIACSNAKVNERIREAWDEQNMPTEHEIDWSKSKTPYEELWEAQGG